MMLCTGKGYHTNDGNMYPYVSGKIKKESEEVEKAYDETVGQSMTDEQAFKPSIGFAIQNMGAARKGMAFG